MIRPTEKVVIRQCREVTVKGVTHVRELYAQGHIDQSGQFRLERCVGRFGRKAPSETVNPVTAKCAA